MTGYFGCLTNLEKEQAAREEQYLKGRQLLWMLYDHYPVSETDGAILSVQDVVDVGKKGGDLRVFLKEWEITQIPKNTS